MYKPRCGLLTQQLTLGLALIVALLLAHSAQAGVYVDCNGKAHPWHVTKTHALIWDGKPYIPIGGMFCSTWLGSPTAQNFAWDRKKLLMDRRAGIEDLYLNTIFKQPAPITQRIINAFEKLGLHYGIQFPGVTGGTEPGYQINAPTNVIAVHKAGVVKFADKAAQARYIVVAAKNGQILQSGVTVGTPQGFSINVPHCPPGGALVTLVPRISTTLWVAPNADGLIAWLKPLRFGPNLRFFLDPIGNEFTPLRGFLPSSTGWRAAFATWLQRRYQTIPAIAAAWGITAGRLRSFRQASRLVPLTSGGRGSAWPQLGYAVDGQHHNGRIVALNMAVCRMWLDMCHFRDVFLRRRLDIICHQLRKFCDVPIVAKRHYESTRLWISRNGKQGLDGLGMESYGTGDELGRFNGAATYADVAQSKRPLWLLATETSSSHWQNRYIGYKTQAIMYRDFNMLLSLGARGIFTFGLSLRASAGDNQWTIFEVNNDPCQLQWMALFGHAARARTNWLRNVPKVAFWFPVENTDGPDFMDTAMPNYGLSGAWNYGLVKQEHPQALLGLVPHRWVAPVFYPGGLPHGSLVLYNRQLMKNKMLARDAALLRSTVPANQRCAVAMTDPVKLPARLATRFAQPQPPLVNLQISKIAAGVQAVTWRDRANHPRILLQASGHPMKIELSAKSASTTWAMVRLPKGGHFKKVPLPLTIELPGAVLTKRQFMFGNLGFGAKATTFSEMVGPAPAGVTIRGIPPSDLSVKVLPQITRTFRASRGFSGKQGRKAWSYAGVNFSGAGNLVRNEVMAVYDKATSTWTSRFPGGAFVRLTATQQDKTEGNADFSLRLWTAPRAYDSVTITSTLKGTVTEGAWIACYNKKTGRQKVLCPPGDVLPGGLVAGHGVQMIHMNATLTNVNAGDRIYFVLQNSGTVGSANNVLQTWNPTIVAQYATRRRTATHNRAAR